MKKITKTHYYSYKIGNLAKGCKYCVKGSKMVFFVTGLCPRCCYFCPISDKKYKKDVIYADEWKVGNIREIIEEAKAILAEGAGFTGGDPLCKLFRTTFTIRKLKEKFGKKFHIHLYTSPDLISKDSLKRLYNAGLDEIRFHLDVSNDKLWNRIKLALDYNWDVGIEIPVIPGKFNDYKKIIRFIDTVNRESKNKIKFLNLNELEVADNKVNKLIEMGFKTKDDLSYAIKGSEESALKILQYISEKDVRLNVHYCTAKLKDKVQLSNRIKRRAKNVSYSFDKITSEGMLKRGVIYLPELKPGFSYMKNIESLKSNKKNSLLKKLNKKRKELLEKLKLEKNEIKIDDYKLRLLTSQSNVKKYNKDIKKLKLIPALVEEYPTQDSLEIEVRMF